MLLATFYGQVVPWHVSSILLTVICPDKKRYVTLMLSLSYILYVVYLVLPKLHED